VGALVISGGGFAAYLTGSLTALFTTAYGLVLLAKIGLVAGLLGLAALNRFRLVPDLRGGDISAAARLQTSINLEIAVVAVILTLTAVLTNALALPMPLPM
jgi:putative copper resistance protein D